MMKLSDFWAIHSETEKNGRLVVVGELAGGKRIKATFDTDQDGPRGSWTAYRVDELPGGND